MHALLPAICSIAGDVLTLFHGNINVDVAASMYDVESVCVKAALE